MKNIVILPWAPEYSPAFDKINREWIAEMFVIESIDDAVLRDPQTHIIEPGGDILFAALETGDIVGTGALKRYDDGAFELTKMGVTAAARGKKIGEVLLNALIEKAQKKGANELFLLTNSACEAAIHLYEKAGFSHNDVIKARFGTTYLRCDVAMKYSL